MKKISFCAVVLLVFAAVHPLLSRSWDDLDEGERKYYGSEKEKKLKINAGLVEWEKWENHDACMVLGFYKSTEYPKYSSLRILPFWYRLNSKIDNRQMTTIPLLLYYNRIDGKDEITVSPVYFSDRESREIDRSLLYLFWWGSDTYGGKKSYLLNPLFYYSRDFRGPEGKRSDELMHFSPLHYYTSLELPSGEKSSYTWFAPIIPLVYYRNWQYGTHGNILWGIDWETDRDRLKNFWLLPLFMYDNDDRKGIEDRSYMSWLFYYSSYSNEANKYNESSFWMPIIPLVYYSRERDNTHLNLFWLFDRAGNKNGMERLWLAPLFFYGAESYLHIVPPIYMSWGPEKDRTHMGLVYYVNSREKAGDYLAGPFFWSNDEVTGGSSFHLFPFYYSWSSETKDYTSAKNMLLPLWYYNGADSSLLKEATFVTPLWYYSSTENLHKEKVVFEESRLWVPVLPLLYSSYTTERGNSKSLLTLLGWSSGKEGEFLSFRFIPFFFHKAGKGGYRYYLPFYARPGGWTEEEGISFGLFPVNLHSWSKEGETEWYAFLYYSSEYPERKAKVFNVMPIYWSFAYRDWYMNFTLPLFFEYGDEKGSINVTPVGYYNIDVGQNYNLPPGRTGWFFDTDLSVLYGVFSLSYRKTIKKPLEFQGDAYEEDDLEEIEINDLSSKGKEEKAAPLKKKGPSGDSINMEVDKYLAEVDAEKPKIVERKEYNRENSISFFGWKFLFGLIAYEKIDVSKKHFRALPLSWLSWDEKSEDEIIWVLNYVSYQSENFGYRVFFPFYGSQHEGNSYKRGYLLNAYWDEYDDAEDLRERTVLWPIFNWYDSPKRHGCRIFPLVWHYGEIGELTSTETTVSPLYYSRVETAYKDNRVVDAFSISPFHYRSVDGERGTFWFPIIPLYYRSTEGSLTSHTLLAFINWQSDSSRNYGKVSFFPLYSSTWDGDSYDNYYLLNLYWSEYRAESKYRDYSVLWPIFNRYHGPREKGWRIFPLFWRQHTRNKYNLTSYMWGPVYYGSTTYDRNDGHMKSSLFISPLYMHVIDGESSARWAPIIPLVYHNISPVERHFNFLWIFDYWKNYENGQYRLWTFPLFMTRTGPSGYRYVFPLVYQNWDGNDMDELYFFYWNSETPSQKKSSFHLMPLYFSWDGGNDYSKFIAGLYLYRSKDYNRTNLLYLYDHKYWQSRQEDSYGFLLGTIHYRNGPIFKEFGLLYDALLYYRNHKRSDSYDFEVLYYLYRNSQKKYEYVHDLFPLWFYRSHSDNDWSFLCPPLLSYIERENNGDSLQAWLMGALWYRNYRPSRGKDRLMVLMGIPYYRIERPKNRYSAHGSLWGYLWEVEEERKTGFYKFSLLKFLYKKVTLEGETYHKILGFRL